MPRHASGGRFVRHITCNSATAAQAVSISGTEGLSSGVPVIHRVRSQRRSSSTTMVSPFIAFRTAGTKLNCFAWLIQR